MWVSRVVLPAEEIFSRFSFEPWKDFLTLERFFNLGKVFYSWKGFLTLARFFFPWKGFLTLARFFIHGKVF